ncbi:FAD-binding oxidoreductase [Angustibacter sp. Root456]|uniref:NAD(P)/FAD-dependent oxidoreductase n=1 Tax=Angustibacter sp. Root456 TaxID=1736539 RepID=UPI0006FA6C99|nr:FAD-dependent oxidoreductase [Angustibacter sp. Root456]KQX63707.1 FAD-dependent oxidoreductase [Angustibacter sp. Root456]
MNAALGLDGASSTPYWLDSAQRPAARPRLMDDEAADLVVVGGGLTGLWAALIALEEQPGRDVLVIEGHRLAWAASGRNGGFCAASLTHGVSNGHDRWPSELSVLARLGRQNLDAIEEAVERYGIDCDFRRSGELDVAVEPWQLDGLAEEHELATAVGESSQLLDARGTRALVDSPTYLGGRYDARGVAMVDPARLVWGLADAVERLGGRIRESTRVLDVLDLGARGGGGVVVRTPDASVRARQVVLGTNVFPSPVKRYRPYVVPVWDHVIVTEPLSDDLLATIGWEGRQGVGDAGNQFHYYRLTPDRRLLFGGYDALYYFGNDMTARRARNERTEHLLADHLVQAFPALRGLRVTHAWGGAIDTCTRFSAFWGLSHGGQVASVQGYTGLGVGASRFGAQVCLDLLSQRENERTALEMVRRKPVPFPPEPLRWTGIQLTRRAIARADARQGRRGLWLRALDRTGLGFDS